MFILMLHRDNLPTFGKFPITGEGNWGGGRRAQGAGRKATGAGHRAQGTGRKATGAGRKATGAGRRATGAGHRVQGTGCRAQGRGGSLISLINRMGGEIGTWGGGFVKMGNGKSYPREIGFG